MPHLGCSGTIVTQALDLWIARDFTRPLLLPFTSFAKKRTQHEAALLAQHSPFNPGVMIDLLEILNL